MENEHSVEAKSFETREALVERFKLRGRSFEAQYACRMRKERDHRGKSACAAGALYHAAENLLVADVNAVEIADGENGARIRVES
jgi:hypothetical protein